MGIDPTQVPHKVTITTVTNAPTKLPTTPMLNRYRVLVMNDTGSVIRIGDETVSMTKGIELKNQEVREYVIGPAIELWAIKATGSGPVVTHEMS